MSASGKALSTIGTLRNLFSAVTYAVSSKQFIGTLLPYPWVESRVCAFWHTFALPQNHLGSAQVYGCSPDRLEAQIAGIGRIEESD
jgi:hypothetical protein